MERIETRVSESTRLVSIRAETAPPYSTGTRLTAWLDAYRLQTALHMCIRIRGVAQTVANKIEGQDVDHHEHGRQPIPGAHRQTSGAHNTATAAPAQLDPARQPARPHALKNRHYDPTPAFPPPSRYSVSRAAQTDPAPAAALTPAPAPHKLHPPAPRETPAPTAPAPPPHPARTGADESGLYRNEI